MVSTTPLNTRLRSNYPGSSLYRNKHLPSLITNRGLRNVIPLDVSDADAGLEGIPRGLQVLREGKVSAKKLAYRI